MKVDNGFVSCTRCDERWSTVAESMGHKCFDVQAWKAVALEIGLRVEDNAGTEVEITNRDDPDRGVLWVSRLDMLKIEPGDTEIITIDPGQALAVLGRLHRVSRKCQFCSEQITPGSRHHHFGRVYH